MPDDFVLDTRGSLRDPNGTVLAEVRSGSWTVLLKRDQQRLTLPGGGASWPVVAVPRRAELLFSLLTRDVAEELAFTHALHGDLDRADAVDRVVQALELQALLCRGLRELSGGEQARVALAIALLAQPAVLVLQDTLAAIDVERRARVCRALQTYNVGVLEVRGMPLETDSPAQTIVWSEESEVRVLTRQAYQGVAPGLSPPSVVQWGTTSTDTRLQVSGLSYSYPNAFRLAPVDLIARPGQIVRIAGQNGAGKSTLMRSLAQLLLPDSGNVTIHGKGPPMALRYPVRRRTRGLARQLLYQFQDPDHQIYCGTVREELAETARHVGGTVREPEAVAAELGLSQYLNTSPWDLSEGQRRLLTLGSILCAEPPLLLADEPTAQLDWVQRTTVAKALLRYAADGGTCLYVAHDESFNAALAAASLTLPLPTAGDGRPT